MLREPGIDPQVIHLLDPGEEGTVVRNAATLMALIEQGVPPGEAVTPLAATEDIYQLFHRIVEGSVDSAVR